MCPSRLRRSTQVVTESTAVLFDTRSAGDALAAWVTFVTRGVLKTFMEFVISSLTMRTHFSEVSRLGGSRK